MAFANTCEFMTEGVNSLPKFYSWSGRPGERRAIRLTITLQRSCAETAYGPSSSMLKSLSRFAGALMWRPYAWVGFVAFVLSLAEYFVSDRSKREMAKWWRPENDVWLTFAGGLLLLWAAFRAWDSQRQLAQRLSPDSLRHELAELKLQLAEQKRRRLTSDQRSALVEALKESGEPLRINVVYHHLNDEAEEYARQFSAALLPERFAGGATPDDIPADLEGVVLRVKDLHAIPPGAQRLSNALTKAGVGHQLASLTGVRSALAPSDYFDLAIGRMK
jgi:hypothetical protein